ncbi:Gag-polypeptide of LTR copia-type [Sesbania bispinosa]|nr:Gag-polypeptide of LTR copia-type [Sesbania bispinosa]
MIIALSVKNKLGFVDGSIPQPPADDPQLAAWFRCNNVVISWLYNSVSKEIVASIMYFRLASEIWNDLKIHGYPPGFKNKSKGPNVVAQVSDSSTGTVNQLSAAQCQQLIDLLSSQLTVSSTSNDKPDDQAFSSGQAVFNDDWEG